MHAGVIEHYISEGIVFFLCDKLVKRFDDRLGGHRHGRGVVWCGVVWSISFPARLRNPNTFSLRLCE